MNGEPSSRLDDPDRVVAKISSVDDNLGEDDLGERRRRNSTPSSLDSMVPHPNGRATGDDEDEGSGKEDDSSDDDGSGDDSDDGGKKKKLKKNKKNQKKRKGEEEDETESDATTDDEEDASADIPPREETPGKILLSRSLLAAPIAST